MSYLSQLITGILALSTGALAYSNYQKNLKHEQQMETNRFLLKEIQEMNENCVSQSQFTEEFFQFVECIPKESLFKKDPNDEKKKLHKDQFNQLRSQNCLGNNFQDSPKRKNKEKKKNKNKKKEKRKNKQTYKLKALKNRIFKK
ncbi:hypothetical protein M0812_05887 [Anaeramoeba flamelloides]|uniref:Transmembrane protein n=1 Tax=Anaeramoeba flamelloides TaxID=1746091 RepID=A0AAV8A7E2_9EUKA|nr:hypothetical protein M0812_05887 [Anaeramoeba flamelloides]